MLLSSSSILIFNKEAALLRKLKLSRLNLEMSPETESNFLETSESHLYKPYLKPKK